MATDKVKRTWEMPTQLYAKLEALAAQENRSIVRQLRHLIEQATKETPIHKDDGDA